MSSCPHCGAEVAAATAAAEAPVHCPACDHRLAGSKAEEAAAAPGPSFVSTKWLIGINLAVFLAMTLSRVPLLNPTVEQLQRWGANYGPLTFGGQPWRLITNVFEHIGIAHLIVNMWALWQVGALAEQLYGRAAYLFVYLYSGIAGSLASAGWHPFVTGAGASGAIFGVMGALIITLRFGDLSVPREAVRPVVRSLILLALFTLGLGLIRPSDDAAHIGGLLAGALLGAVINLRSIHGPGTAPNRAMAGAALAAILGGVGIQIAHARAYVVPFTRAQAALQKNQLDEAARQYQVLAAMRPRDGEAQLLLARAYLRKQDLPAAEQAFRRATELSPNDPEAWTELGVFYQETRRPQYALDAFTRVTKLAPYSAPAQIQLGIALAATNRMNEALQAYQRAAQLQPNLAAAYLNLGIAYMHLQDYDHAITSFKKLAELAPSNFEAQAGLAAAYTKKGMDKEAKEAFVRALRLRGSQAAPNRASAPRSPAKQN